MTSAVARVRQWGGPARLAIIVLVFVAVLFVFVYPTRSYLTQRGAVNNTKHDVQVMREQNDKLEKEAQRLKTAAEVERIAREQYHYVYPGEQAYSVIPAPAPTTTTTKP